MNTRRIPIKKVLLTNAGGFLGRNLYDKLVQDKDIQLTAIHGRACSYDAYDSSYLVFDGDSGRINNTYGDLNDPDFLSYVGAERFDVVYHLAGIAKTASLDDRLLTNNVKATFNLLKITPGARFVYTSSSTVYGDGNKYLPFDEGDRCCPTSFYGASKLMCEDMINLYTRQGHINGVNVRLCAVVGRNATHGLLPDLINKIKSDKTELELFGDAPGSTKPYVHIDDVLNSLLYFSNNDCRLAWNVCSNDTLSVQEMAEIVEDELKLKECKKRKWLGESSLVKGDNKEFAMSNNKLVKRGFKFQYKNSEQAVVAVIQELIQ